MSNVKKVIGKIKDGSIKEYMEDFIWIYQMAKKYWVLIIIYTLLSFVSVGINMLISLKVKDIVDSLVEKNLEILIQGAVFYIGFSIINVVFTMALRRMVSIIGYKVYQGNTLEVYHKILTSDWETLTEHHSGDLIARLSKDVVQISDCVVEWIPKMLSQLVLIMAAVTIITYYDASMLIVLVLSLPIIILGSKIFWNKLYISNQKGKVVESKLISFEKESFHNIQSIKAFGLASYFDDRMRQLQKEITQAGLDINKYSILSWAVMYLCGQLAAVICLSWAVYHVYTGAMSVGTMTMIAVMASYISGAFKVTIDLIPSAMSTVASAVRIRNLLEIPEEVLDDTDICERIYKEGLTKGVSVEINHMSFQYKTGKNIFDQVSMKAEPGKIIAIVGASGAGKTTMLRVLLGIVKNVSGENIIYVGEEKKDYINIGPSTRRLIAYVPQGNTIMQGTIAQNMRIVCQEATDEEIEDALKTACAYDFISKLKDGIYHNIGEGGTGFSEGQNQRLAIARALLCNTPILLLDEATSALDVALERKILNNLMNQCGTRTCILTTHRPTVLSLCDKVFRISDGTMKQIEKDELTQLINDF